jgi:hypothetical protein
MLTLDESSKDVPYLDMAWSTPEYAKKRVNSSGRLILMDASELEEGDMWDDYFNALGVVNNWRSSHAFPLNTFQTGLRRRGKALDKNCLVAQRIKRLSSIEAKLSRFPTMTLSQMQDIGGCRAILDNIGSVKKLCKAYAESEIKHKLHHSDDYLLHPKDSGYRGVHLVYRYYSDKSEIYNSLLIEMQIRSQLQHAWATAVEVFGAFVNQALKSSVGKKEYLRFFTLMGSAISFRENSPPVANTPSNYRLLVGELREHAKDLDIAQKLSAFGAAVRIYENNASKNDHFFLVEVNHDTRQVTVETFPFAASKAASERYLEVEKEAKSKPYLDAVLVSVDSMAALQKAYPNYFLDTRLFNQVLEETIRTTTVPKKKAPKAQLQLL